MKKFRIAVSDRPPLYNVDGVSFFNQTHRPRHGWCSNWILRSFWSSSKHIHLIESQSRGERARLDNVKHVNMAIWYSNNQVFIGWHEWNLKHQRQHIDYMFLWCINFAHEACFKNNSRHETRFPMKTIHLCVVVIIIALTNSPPKCRCLLILFTASIPSGERERKKDKNFHHV